MLADRGARTPLAIVGIGCHFPGGAHTPEGYWDLLRSGTDATSTIPESRWNAEKYYDPNPDKIGKMITRRGGFLGEVDQFDAQFFGVSPREANWLDPQQRLLLRTTWEALEDGGIPPDRLAGTEVGVFIGGFTLDYQLLQNHGRTSRYRFKPHSATGMMMTMMANRISFTFDFRGPSMTVDTACSSSLVAVHLAAQSIWNDECDLALAGGVNIMVGPNTSIAESKGGFLSPDGRCKTFDESADGYARGEGGAVVVIKPLERAIRDRDTIYAQILGTAVSQDGHTAGITIPSEGAQEAAISTALRRAGVEPNEIGYVEAHGTGTPVGDPVEVVALANALTANRPTSSPLLVGSVKTNIGHLEAAAGIAGLTKAALMLKYGYIPPNLNLKNPSAQIPLGKLNIEIPRTGREWPASAPRRLAGVNSFGFGGTNAHVVLAEPPDPISPPAGNRSSGLPLAVLPLSGRSEEALAASARQLAEHLETGSEVTLTDLGYTLSQRRSHLTYRRALVADSVTDARDQLRALADGPAALSQIRLGRTSSSTPKLAYVFTGIGPQLWKMCRDLLDVYPVFTDSIQRSGQELRRYTGWSLVDELRADETSSRMAEAEVAQPANFAVQIALAEQLKEFGIVPDAVIGHSAGEVAAQYIAGVLTFEQAIQVIYHRSYLQQRTTGLGSMLAIGLSPESLIRTVDEKTLEEIGSRVSIAAINSPSAVTAAGDTDVLSDIARQLSEVGIFNRFLSVKVPYHSHYMDELRNDLSAALHDLSPAAGTIAIYSTVTGERLDGPAANSAYWWQNVRSTVLFEPALRRMIDDGYTHFVQLGPHPVLASSIAEIAQAAESDVVVLASQRRNEDDGRTLMNCVGALHCHGHSIAWDVIYPRASARLLKLPRYPWQTRRFWNEPQEATEYLHYNPVHPLLGQAVDDLHPTWEAEFSLTTTPFLTDHKVQGNTVVPGAVFIEMALAVAKEAYGSSDYCVENLTLHRALILDETYDPIVRTTLNRATAAIEFAAYTATPDGNLHWTITATAELSTRVRLVNHDEPGGQGDGVNTVDHNEFYALTRAIGFDYGDAFQSVSDVTSGSGWAMGRITAPESIAGELDEYRFHPVLIDGALQILFAASLSGQDMSEGPYLPTRIRRTIINCAPERAMTAHVRIVSATKDKIESDITITNDAGEPVAVLEGFTVQSLNSSSKMSPERVDKGLYEVHWVADDQQDHIEGAAPTENFSWLIMMDDSGIGAALCEELRRQGQTVRTVSHRPVNTLSERDGGYIVNSRQPEQLHRLLEAHIEAEGDLAGIINCWPLDIPPYPDAESNASTLTQDEDNLGSEDAIETGHRIGVFPILHLVKALANHDNIRPRLYLVTANAQPAPGTGLVAVNQAAIWGLGRVIGHQEFSDRWGGLIDIDDADEPTKMAARVCQHILAAHPEDQIAIRGNVRYVPRIGASKTLTPAFPTKLAPDATYVVTGGSGALGRVVAEYLAERGARNIVLLSRRGIPPRDRWPHMTADDPQHATIDTVRKLEQLGAQVTAASIDVTDADQLKAWLSDFMQEGGPPVRGVIHAAGSVSDHLLVNMTETTFAEVIAPKIAGTRALHDTFRDHDLEFFIMFGSVGSVIASPGQGNYAAANAFLDAFAHYRQAQGLPALTIGWGPWSVGMVEELNLEKIYARRGIELITPAAGVRILDRLINQKTPNILAISADWERARSVGLGASLPLMYSELGRPETGDRTDSGSSILDTVYSAPEEARITLVTSYVQEMVATVFGLAVADVSLDETLNALGLDSMMAIELKTRIATVLATDLPVLDLLKGISVYSLAERILAELQSAGHGSSPIAAEPSDPGTTVDDIDRLIEQLSESDLRELLSDLEVQHANQEIRDAHLTSGMRA